MEVNIGPMFSSYKRSSDRFQRLHVSYALTEENVLPEPIPAGHTVLQLPVDKWMVSQEEKGGCCSDVSEAEVLGSSIL